MVGRTTQTVTGRHAAHALGEVRARTLVLLILATVPLAACSGDSDDVDEDDDGPTTSEPGTPGGDAPAGDFAVVMNDGTSPGSVTFFTPDLATAGITLSTGANQGIAFGPDGTLYQNGDSDAFTGIRGFTDAVSRPDMDGFGDADRTIAALPGKGLSVIDGTELVASCDVTDQSADLKFFSTAAGEEGSDPVLSFDLEAPCWDTFHAVDTDRLYVALTTGQLAIFDALSVEVGPAAEGSDTDGIADRTLVPSTVDEIGVATNFHGVSAENGRVLVSDVGDADIANDGRLFVFVDDGSINGNVPVASVGGPSTMLGNPVDVVLKDGNAIVAEKSNDAILVFNGIEGLAGDREPDYSLPFTKPESIEQIPAL